MTIHSPNNALLKPMGGNNRPQVFWLLDNCLNIAKKAPRKINITTDLCPSEAPRISKVK